MEQEMRRTWGKFRGVQLRVLQKTRGVPVGGNRHVVQGGADSGEMNDLGKPGAGERHARIDERGLETGYGFGTAAPAAKCVDSAGPVDHRASPRLYPILGFEAAGVV